MKKNQTSVLHRSANISPASVTHPVPMGTLTASEIRQIIQEMMG